MTGWRPKAYHHKKPGQKVGLIRLRIGGRTYYPGAWDDPKAWKEHDRLLTEWSSNNHAPPAPLSGPTCNELFLAFDVWALSEYVKDGKHTSELYCFRSAIRHARELHGHTLVAQFDAKALKAVRACYVAIGWSRPHCNEQVNRLRRVFLWGSENDFCARAHAEELKIRPLLEGKTTAPEGKEIEEVAPEVVAATLPLLRAELRDMIQLQRTSGARPSEVCQVRPSLIERKKYLPEWLYTPSRYKTQHHNVGKKKAKRKIWLGQKCQAILLPRIEAAVDLEQPLFLNTKGVPYNKDTYGRAIRRAIESHNLRVEKKKAKAKKAGRASAGPQPIPHWSPNQLRHALATDVEERFDLEHSQAALGHQRIETTQVYAHAKEKKARKVARELG